MSNITLKDFKFNKNENPRGKILSTVEKKTLNKLEKQNIKILLEKRKEKTKSILEKNILENIIKSLELPLNHEINVKSYPHYYLVAGAGFEPATFRL